MKLFFLLTISILPVLCIAQTGRIYGNIFYTYNEFIGSKPDAGSTVIIFPSDTSQKFIELTSDVQGNFENNNMDTGKYLMVAISKHTNGTMEEKFNELRVSYLKNYLGFSLKELNVSLFDSVANYYEKFLLSGKQPKKSEYKIYLQTINRLFSLIPFNEKTQPILLTLNKIYVKEITVNLITEEKINIDFGLSAF